MRLIKKICFIAVYACIIFAVQTALSFIPGIELTTFLLVLASLVFPLNTSLLICFVYIILEGIFFTFSDYIIVYCIIWPLFILITYMLKKTCLKHIYFTAFMAGIFGLLLGLIFAIEQGLIHLSFTYAISYYLNGVIIDIIHFACNFIAVLFLFEPCYKVINRIINKTIN